MRGAPDPGAWHKEMSCWVVRFFFVVLALCSQDAFPTTLPTVTVVGYRVSGWAVLCEGSGCNAYFTPSTSEPLPGEASLPPEVRAPPASKWFAVVM